MKKFNNMTEFARHLGLARSTVSYILNDKWQERNISPVTARRVLDFAREVQFSPNLLGLAINGKLSIDLAILLPSNPYGHHCQAFFDFLRIVEQHKLKFLVFQLSDESNNNSIVDWVSDFRVSRVLIISAPLLQLAPESEFEYWRQVTARHSDIEWLFYDYRYERTPANFHWPDNVRTVGFDAFEAALRITEYVAARGYRKFHIFNASGDARWAPCAAYGIETVMHELPGYGEYESEREALGRAIADVMAAQPRPKQPEAVFIHNDLSVIYAIDRLREHGLRVPEDYAIVAWDGLKISELFRSSLTTLVVPHSEMLKFAEQFVVGTPVPASHLVHPLVRTGETMP